MKRQLPIYFEIILVFFGSFQVLAETIVVNSQATFNSALAAALADDVIEWENGTYSDIYMQINKSDLTIKAAEAGEVIFNGASRARVDGDRVTISGFQFVGGDIGTNHVLRTFGNYTTFTQLNIKNYQCHKYLIVYESSQYATISYCNFENRITVADKNILSIEVSSTNPGYHKVQYCSFKNFPGGGNDEGVEPIRIGASTQGGFDSRSVVEYCYFTQCDGDGELISNKSSQNVFRYNTFEDNSKAELVLRHGAEVVVYGNFFLNGMGGVRVREGQNHVIFNNYFSGQKERSIFLQNEASDPLDSILIAYNTLVDTDVVLLAGTGVYPPTNVTFANNIFAQPMATLFDDPTGTETWIGNIATGALGMPLPAGITLLDPKLQKNSQGYYELSSDSPAIDAAEMGYPIVPEVMGLGIDTEVVFDVMEQGRPISIAQKDVGCSEYPHTLSVMPVATEQNTGPSYDTDLLRIDSEYVPVTKAKPSRLFPNPIQNELHIVLEYAQTLHTEVVLYDVSGRRLSTLVEAQELLPGKHRIFKNLSATLPGVYVVKIQQQQDFGIPYSFEQTLKFVKE